MAGAPRRLAVGGDVAIRLMTSRFLRSSRCFLATLNPDIHTTPPMTCAERLDAATLDRNKRDLTPCTFFRAPQPMMISPSCDPHRTTHHYSPQTCRPHKTTIHRQHANTSLAAGQARRTRYTERNDPGSTTTTLITSPSLLQKTPDQSGTHFHHLALKPRPRIHHTNVPAPRSWKVHGRLFR